MRLPEDAPRGAGRVIGGLETNITTDALIPQQAQKCKTLLDEAVFRLFVHPGEIVEVRALGVDGKPKLAMSGYFDDHALFSRAVQDFDRRVHAGVYFTLQVIDPRLIARACNRLKPGDLTTSDKDTLAYRWLPIDLDPVRPAGIPSSDSELKAALDLREPVTTWVMQEIGLPAPVKAMSGNGGHLLFRLPDWPATNENRDIIKGILAKIHETFSTDKVKIDTSVFNPARIWNLYGTRAKKGDQIPANQYREARLHRMTYIDDLGGATW